ncbi:monooxygenase family protein [Lyngbya aestuarii]|uniref:monooxygenase family protein n=1 Tax=Lyngbya aestuarii TaxID=118322 RepID=UPI00403E261C
MAKVVAGRFTAQRKEPFVVFLIGMRVNRFFAFSKWVPVAKAMKPMLNTLYQNPDKGFLGGELFLYWPGAALVQYWRSFEDLEKFAKNPDHPHLEAWRHFNQAIGSDGSVGIWHETYRIEPGNYEAIYVNMPVFGLAAATKHIPVTKSSETARGRLEPSL